MIVPHFPKIGVELGFDGQGIGKIVQSARGLGNSAGRYNHQTKKRKQEEPHGAKLLPVADLKKINQSIQHIGFIYCLLTSNTTMKYLITKILLVWAALAAIVGISKKRENESLNDAVKFPRYGKNYSCRGFRNGCLPQPGLNFPPSFNRKDNLIEYLNISFAKLCPNITFAPRVHPGFFMPINQ